MSNRIESKTEEEQYYAIISIDMAIQFGSVRRLLSCDAALSTACFHSLLCCTALKMKMEIASIVYCKQVKERREFECFDGKVITILVNPG